MNRPIRFEIHSPVPERSRHFFEEVFGWKFSRADDPQEYWLAVTGSGPGIDGGLLLSTDGQPRTVNTIVVANLEETASAALRAGGTVVLPKRAIPGVGWIAYLADPGGAIVGIVQGDKNAK